MPKQKFPAFFLDINKTFGDMNMRNLLAIGPWVILATLITACSDQQIHQVSSENGSKTQSTVSNPILITETFSRTATLKPGYTPTIKLTEEGYGGIIGNVDNAFDTFPDQNLTIYSAEFYGDPEGDGFYILEPSLFSKAVVNRNGNFEIINVKPGYYILVVGPYPEYVKVITDKNKPMIIEVSENQVVDLGNVKLAP